MPTSIREKASQEEKIPLVATGERYGTRTDTGFCIETPIFTETGWRARVDGYFHITARGSTIERELFAGFIDYIANAYLLVLVPQMLEQGGLPNHESFSAFAFATFFSSFVLGLWANLPLAAGPGIGCATYFAYGLADSTRKHGEALTDQATYALTVCAVSGLVMLVLALINLPSRIFMAVPKSVKDAMPSGLGLLLALCGFQQMGLVATDPDTGVSMGDPTNPTVLMGVFGVILMVFLEKKHFKAYFLVPMFVITGLSWVLGLSAPPTEFVRVPSVHSSIVPTWDDVTHHISVPVFAVYIICLFDVSGIMHACVSRMEREEDQKEQEAKATNTSYLRLESLFDKDEDGNCKDIIGAYAVFVSCALGSCLAAYMGCSPCIVLGETIAGCLVGGRTGLTAVSMSVFFLISGFFGPLLTSIPMFASASVLVLVGVSLTGLARFLDWTDMTKAFPSFCTMALMPYMYSIDKAIMAGLFAHASLVAMEFIYNLPEKLVSCVKGSCSGAKPANPLPSLDRSHSVYDDHFKQQIDKLKLSYKNPNSLSHLKRTFDSLDVDGNGLLHLEEIATWLQEAKCEVSDQETLDFMRQLNRSSDNRGVAYEDFAKWVLASPALRAQSKQGYVSPLQNIHTNSFSSSTTTLRSSSRAQSEPNLCALA